MFRQLSPAMAIVMLVMVLAGFAACSVPLPNRGESQIKHYQDRFDETTKQWMNKLNNKINLLIRGYIIKIDILSNELSSHQLNQDVQDSISTTILNLSQEIGLLEKIQWEIEYLSRSNQTYLVVENDTLEGAFTSFNKRSGNVNIHIAPDASIALYVHELVHAYQFDQGLASLGHVGDTGGYFLTDSTDEKAAYKRQQMFGDTVPLGNGEGRVLPKEPYSIYNFIRDTGIYRVNLPDLIKKGAIKDLKTVADTMHQAYRVQIDGKWVTIAMKRT